jgi:hypothetical protein
LRQLDEVFHDFLQWADKGWLAEMIGGTKPKSWSKVDSLRCSLEAGYLSRSRPGPPLHEKLILNLREFHGREAGFVAEPTELILVFHIEQF